MCNHLRKLYLCSTEYNFCPNSMVPGEANKNADAVMVVPGRLSPEFKPFRVAFFPE